MCHGDAGRGDGELSSVLVRRANTAPANLSNAERIQRLGAAGIHRVVERGGAHTGRSNLMPAWAGRLTPGQIDDVTAFVVSLPSSPLQNIATTGHTYENTPAGVSQRGQTLFAHHCAACHGLSGHGDGTFAATLVARNNIRPRNLTDATYIGKRTDQELFTTITLGGGHMGKSPYMPTWGGYLTPSQIKDLVSYIRTLSHTAARP